MRYNGGGKRRGNRGARRLRFAVAPMALLLALGSVTGAFAASPAGQVSTYPIPTPGSYPFFIAAGPDGNLWFTENGTNQIGKITTAGTITEYAVPTSNSGPSGITGGPDGNVWFTENGANKIGKITTSGTVSEYAVTTLSSGPEGIATGPDGNLWFTEYSADRIGRITPTGIVTEFPVPTANSEPDGIVAGPDGNLWFTEVHADQIGRITPSGTVTEYPVPTAGGFPEGIAAGPDGYLWFTEAGTQKVGKITTSGTVTEYAVPAAGGVPQTPTGIAPGPDGNLWLTTGAGNRVDRITPTGTVTSYVASGQLGGIAVGPDGNMWFTEEVGNAIGSIGTQNPQPVASVTPSTHDFGSVTPGQTSQPLSVTVNNVGQAPLTMGSAQLTGAQASAFTISGDQCSGATVQPGAACEIDVTYTPTSDGSYSASLAVNDNGSDSPQSVPLSGHTPPPAITSADHTTFTVGTPGSFTVTATGHPAPSLSETGTLPAGVTFTDHGDGTAALAGTPASGSAASYPITITAHDTVSPDAQQSFTLSVNPPQPHTLTVARSGLGTGTVSSTPGGIDCGSTCSTIFAQNTQVTLTPTPAPGSWFTGWSGDCTGTGSCTMTMNADQNVLATFGRVAPVCKIVSPSVILVNDGSRQSVALDGSRSYDPGGGGLTYSWSGDGPGSISPPTGSIASDSFSGSGLGGLASWSDTLKVSNGKSSASCVAQITVVDTLPPQFTVTPHAETFLRDGALTKNIDRWLANVQAFDPAAPPGTPIAVSNDYQARGGTYSRKVTWTAKSPYVAGVTSQVSAVLTVTPVPVGLTASVTAFPNGTATTQIRCNLPQACVGNLQLDFLTLAGPPAHTAGAVMLGHGTIRIKPHRQATVLIHFTPGGRRVLAARHTGHLREVIRVHDHGSWIIVRRLVGLIYRTH